MSRLAGANVHQRLPDFAAMRTITAVAMALDHLASCCKQRRQGIDIPSKRPASLGKRNREDAAAVNSDSQFVAYPIRVPFAVDLPDGSEVSILVSGDWVDQSIPDKPAVTLRFGVVSANTPDLSVAQFKWTAMRGEDGSSPRQPTTADLVGEEDFVDYIIEAETRNAFLTLDSTDSTEAIFARCLSAVNQFIWAYMVATEDPAIRFLTIEILDGLQLADYRDRPGVSKGVGEVHMLSTRLPGHLKENRQVSERLDYLGLALHNFEFSHPIDRARVWLTKSSHALGVAGDYEQAVLYLEVAAEALMSAIEELHLVDQGKTSAEISSILESKRSLGQFLSRMQTLLGGNWNGQAKGPVGDFNRILYRLRNRIAHRAEHISYDDAREAFTAYEAFETFVLRRVQETRSKQPRIAFGVFGRAGLQRAGVLDARMREFATSQEGIPGPFWAPVDLRRSGWDEPTPFSQWLPAKTSELSSPLDSRFME